MPPPQSQSPSANQPPPPPPPPPPPSQTISPHPSQPQSAHLNHDNHRPPQHLPPPHHHHPLYPYPSTTSSSTFRPPLPHVSAPRPPPFYPPDQTQTTTATTTTAPIRLPSSYPSTTHPLQSQAANASAAAAAAAAAAASEPFPNSKSLPFPISHHAPRSPQQPIQQQQQQQQQPAQQTPSYVMYDIAKLHLAQCTVIAGKVYNDKGHSICGVLNQHDKPCKRIGKCPFHGVFTPVTQHNACSGTVDADGTALPTSEHNQDSTVAPEPVPTTPRVPPKKMQYKHGWTKEEHFLFLRGLQLHDRGSWKQIAAVVQSRTPTQVQSHAQKYYLRQKQNNKNKRSIHDLTMDSVEMRQLEKRFRAGEFKNNMPPIALSDTLYVPPGTPAASIPHHPNTDPLASTKHHIQPPHAASGSAINFHQEPLQHAVSAMDANLNRFNQTATVSNPISALQPPTARYGHAQPMSATTLGSSVSSAVHMPQFPGPGHQNRASLGTGSPFLSHQQHPSSHAQQADLLPPASYGTISTTARKPSVMNTMHPRMEQTPPSRDIAMAAARPAFPQDTYSNGNVGQNYHSLSPKAAPYPKADPSILIAPGNVEASTDGHQLVASAQQSHYAGNSFQSLYTTPGAATGAAAAALFHPAQRMNGGEGQFAWYETGDVKQKRARDSVGNAKEALQLQNSLGGMGGIGMPDGFANVAAGMPNEQPVGATFDGNSNQQPSAFASGLFGGAEGVVVGEGPTSYGISSPAAQGNPTNIGVSVSINGLAGPNGLQLGALPVRGPGQMSNTPFARN